MIGNALRKLLAFDFVLIAAGKTFFDALVTCARTGDGLAVETMEKGDRHSHPDPPVEPRHKRAAPNTRASASSGRSIPSAAGCVCALRAEPAFLRPHLVVEFVEEAEADQPIDVVAGGKLEHVQEIVRHDESKG